MAMVKLSKGTDCENNLKLAYQAANNILREYQQPSIKNPDDIKPDLSAYGDLGTPVSIDKGHTPEETVSIDGANAKVARLNWIMYDGKTFDYSSQEKGVVKIDNKDVRTWYSLSHEEIVFSGFYSIGEVEMLNVKPNPSFIVGSLGHASMEIGYQLKFTIGLTVGSGTIGLPAYQTKTLYSAANWDTNFKKIR